MLLNASQPFLPGGGGRGGGEAKEDGGGEGHVGLGWDEVGGGGLQT